MVSHDSPSKHSNVELQTLHFHNIKVVGINNCMYSASYLVAPTFVILTCDDVLLPTAESTGAIKF